ncbi:alpha/beta hydrolase [Purpureocillium lavendulum]|uniref:Alpha/beta hydrolase n=1 Tax=Purpureocillium lavendulum TaxID=1247861 RepID=A0AB34FXR4_9HYPO|nr:alpha/beta hydrolase [Purpureocillium lavendulum]
MAKQGCRRDSIPAIQFDPPSSYDTAVCLIPPGYLWPRLDAIRSLYDKSYAKWPPHVNVFYPFVPPELLSEAARLLSEAPLDECPVALSSADAFVHRNHNSIVLRPAGPEKVSRLRSQICSALGWSPGDVYQPHMTVGQSTDAHSDAHHFLLYKAQLLAPVAWDVTWLAILVRDPSSRRLVPWAQLHIYPRRLQRPPQIQDFPARLPYNEHDNTMVAQSQATYHFQSSENSWRPLPRLDKATTEEPQQLVVASYNVLAEFQWPPNPPAIPNSSQTSSPKRPQPIFSFSKKSRITSSHFFSTTANLLNIVVLSRLPFNWEYIPFQRKHKGAAILSFPASTFRGQGGLRPPLILAACHFTQGLVDGAMVAKRNELQRLINYLSGQYHDHPWIVAGDFNIATSSYTIDSAKKRQDLSAPGLRCLDEVQSLLARVRLEDTWLLTRVELGESSAVNQGPPPPQDLHEGEEGATFNPLLNQLAALSVGSGTNNRPQRYDRIMINSSLALRPSGFNTFGDNDRPASDHWGIRCLLKRQGAERSDGHMNSMQPAPIRLVRSPATLGEEKLRQEAVALLENILLAKDPRTPDEASQAGPSMVLVPVGSFGLGVWTMSSDIDCLCIGTMSAKIFFTIAARRLKKAASEAAVALAFPDVLKRPASDSAFVLPIQTLAKLKPARDLYYLRRSIPDMAQYRLAHLLVKAWATSRGLPTVHTISAEFGRANELLSQEGVTWDEFLGLGTGGAGTVPRQHAAREFVRQYKSYVRVEARYWGLSPSKSRRFFGWLESRFVMLLVDLDRKVPALRARIWPEKFANRLSDSTGTEESDGCYLIGLEWRDGGGAALSNEASRDARRLLETTLRDFESRMQGDNKYYDKRCSWMMVSEADGRDVRGLQPDTTDFSRDGYGDTDSEEDSDSDGDGETDRLEKRRQGTQSTVACKAKTHNLQQAAVESASQGKLRSASDVINRLRWDAAMDADDYIVGYEDRFAGAKEKPLVQWKSEQTDEEFIPQHRILYFRHRSIGDIIWERKTRIDHVFGSGAGRR